MVTTVPTAETSTYGIMLRGLLFGAGTMFIGLFLALAFSVVFA